MVHSLARIRDFSFQGIQTGVEAHPTPYSKGTRAPCLGGEVARPWSWPQSSAKFKNEWSYTSISLYAFVVCGGTTFVVKVCLSIHDPYYSNSY